jgi:hypothetical protein
VRHGQVLWHLCQSRYGQQQLRCMRKQVRGEPWLLRRWLLLHGRKLSHVVRRRLFELEFRVRSGVKRGLVAYVGSIAR